MKSHTSSEVTVSLSERDLEELLDEGEISDGNVTITLFE